MTSSSARQDPEIVLRIYMGPSWTHWFHMPFGITLDVSVLAETSIENHRVTDFATQRMGMNRRSNARSKLDFTMDVRYHMERRSDITENAKLKTRGVLLIEQGQRLPQS